MPDVSNIITTSIMRLEKNYYDMISMHMSGVSGTFYIALRPDCDVYRGHFPGNPVCPGVCNIQTIKECTEWVIGQRLRISSIDRCRLKAVATPSACPELAVRVDIKPSDAGYAVTASVSDEERTYIDFSGEMTV